MRRPAPGRPTPAPPGGYVRPDSGRDPFSVAFEITGTTTYEDAPAAYVGREVWVYGDGITVAVQNGHVLTPSQPGIPLVPSQLYVPGDIVVGRLGPGAGGRVWELFGPSTTPSGSGSGTDVDGDGTADRRLVGYNYDVACVGGRLQKSRQPIYQFLGSGLSSYGSWEAAGQVGCCECDDDPSDGGPTMGTFPSCDDAPSTLDWSITSGDITCLNGLSGSITKSGSVWSNGNNISPPCSSDAGVTVSCVDGVWSGTVDSGGVTCALISQTSTSLTFLIISDGAGTIAAGTATYVVVVP